MQARAVSRAGDSRVRRPVYQPNRYRQTRRSVGPVEPRAETLEAPFIMEGGISPQDNARILAVHRSVAAVDSFNSYPFLTHIIRDLFSPLCTGQATLVSFSSCFALLDAVLAGRGLRGRAMLSTSPPSASRLTLSSRFSSRRRSVSRIRAGPRDDPRASAERRKITLGEGVRSPLFERRNFSGARAQTTRNRLACHRK